MPHMMVVRENVVSCDVTTAAAHCRLRGKGGGADEHLTESTLIVTTTSRHSEHSRPYPIQ